MKQDWKINAWIVLFQIRLFFTIHRTTKCRTELHKTQHAPSKVECLVRVFARMIVACHTLVSFQRGTLRSIVKMSISLDIAR